MRPEVGPKTNLDPALLTAALPDSELLDTNKDPAEKFSEVDTEFGRHREKQGNLSLRKKTLSSNN
jgi:hypothetical protein